MSKRSPTSLTLEALAASGWTADKTEHWVSFGGKGGIRRDLFGGIDILAIRGTETLGVQATSKSNISARVKKLAAEPRLREWVKGGRLLEVWGFDGKDLTVREITEADFEKHQN